MSQSIMTPVALAASLIGGALVAAPAFAQSADEQSDLAAHSLAEGESVRAIAALKSALRNAPGDPALLINLGIAYAQSGSDAEARASFEQALAARQVVELETADGDTIDSRRLARRALAMLERGEFRPDLAKSDQLSMR